MGKRIFFVADCFLKAGFNVLFFLTPLILIPLNYELFEFNKMIFVYLVTIIIVATWLVKMILARKLIFRRSFWNLPLLVFLA